MTKSEEDQTLQRLHGMLSHPDVPVATKEVSAMLHRFHGDLKGTDGLQHLAVAAVAAVLTGELVGDEAINVEGHLLQHAMEEWRAEEQAE